MTAVVEWEQIVKGYEFSKGHFVVLTAEDFEKAALKKDRIIDILDFVSAEAIDDRFSISPTTSYLPRAETRRMRSFERPSRLPARLAWPSSCFARSERLAAIEAIGDALILSTMRFRDELARLEDYDFPAARSVQKRDLQMAQPLISEFSAEWDPDNIPTTTARTLRR